MNQSVNEPAAWGPPPSRGKGRYNWVMIAARLREHPGEWATIFEQDKVSVANAVRQGSVGVVHPDLGFEYRTRNNVRGSGPDRVCDLYMRFNPDMADPTRDAIRIAREAEDAT
jgi:hypothetical protein